MTLTLPLITTAALVDSFNPCAISVLLLTIGFLFSLNRSRKAILTISGTYIFAIFITYVFIGIGILRALSFFGIPHFLTHIGATILAATALINLANQFFPKFPVKLAIPNLAKPHIAKLMSQASHPTAFVMGILVGLFEFPCVGGPYLSILALLHDQNRFLAGVLHLLYYNFVFVLPLIIIAAISSDPRLLSRLQSWRHARSISVKIIPSLVMLILAAVIFSL